MTHRRSPRVDASEPAAAARCAGGEIERSRLMFLLLAALALQPAAPATGWGAPAARSDQGLADARGRRRAKDFRFRRAKRCPSCGCTTRRLGTPHRNAARRDRQCGDGAPRHRRRRQAVPPAAVRRRALRARPAARHPPLLRSSFPTISATANRRSRRTACGCSFPKYDYDDMVEAQHRMLPRRWASRICG